MFNSHHSNNFFLALLYLSPCENSRACHTEFPRLIDSYEGAVEMVANKTCKFTIVDGATAGDAATGRFCRVLVTTGKPMYWGGSSFIMPRGSNLTKALSTTTVSFREDGSLQTVEEFYHERGECPLHSSAVLTVEKLKLFFILCYVGSFVLFIIMLIDPQTPPGQKFRDGKRMALEENEVNNKKGSPETEDSPVP